MSNTETVAKTKATTRAKKETTVKNFPKKETLGKEVSTEELVKELNEKKAITTAEFQLIQKAFAIASGSNFKDLPFKAMLINLEMKLQSFINKKEG